ncbi:hypothetical protein TNCV_1888871 [Trichonephila clavipes]|nr:hypothetical protein TNCV_1888871 [Trichonephila clavipes]
MIAYGIRPRPRHGQRSPHNKSYHFCHLVKLENGTQIPIEGDRLDPAGPCFRPGVSNTRTACAPPVHVLGYIMLRAEQFELDLIGILWYLYSCGSTLSSRSRDRY